MLISKDVTGLSVCTFVGLFYLAYSLQYDYYYYIAGTVRPGPGQMPRIVALLIIACSLFALFESLASRKKKGVETLGEAYGRLVVTKSHRNSAVLAILLISAYLMLINYLGFISGSIILMVLISRIIGEKRWRSNIVLGVTSVLVAYVIFWVVMRIPLPTGSLFLR